jgi:hypothetical protein
MIRAKSASSVSKPDMEPISRPVHEIKELGLESMVGFTTQGPLLEGNFFIGIEHSTFVDLEVMIDFLFTYKMFPQIESANLNNKVICVLNHTETAVLWNKDFGVKCYSMIRELLLKIPNHSFFQIERLKMHEIEQGPICISLTQTKEETQIDAVLFEQRKSKTFAQRNFSPEVQQITFVNYLMALLGQKIIYSDVPGAAIFFQNNQVVVSTDHTDKTVWEISHLVLDLFLQFTFRSLAESTF